MTQASPPPSRSPRERRLALALALLAALQAGATSSCKGEPAGADAGRADAAAVRPDAGAPEPADCGAPDGGAPEDALGPMACPASIDPAGTVGLLACSDGMFKGYTLFAPVWSTTTYLIDPAGRLVHTWPSRYVPGMSVYLLPNGELLRTAHKSMFGGAPTGGGVQRIAWDGTVVWDFDYFGTDYAAHHDVAPMPNGNVLVLFWETKTDAEVIAAGYTSSGDVWPDGIIEVRPTGPTTGEIVWEWHLWDHLLPPKQSAKAHPELIELKYTRNDWTHTNSIAYNAQLDQIALSSRNLSELWVIDHATTTAEAAGHTGGKRGKGGDILYRWGNPRNYGVLVEQKLFGQHDVHWIEPGLAGAGNLLIFNNGVGRGYSTVEEITPPVDGDGNYAAPLPGTPYDPAEATWTYRTGTAWAFFAFHISGAQRLPNGNTLVCSGDTGAFFEITSTGEVVWRYRSPVGRYGPVAQGTYPKDADVFRAIRYAPDYPGLAGRDLTPGAPIESSPDAGGVDGGNPIGDCASSADCRLCCASINLNGYQKLVDWMTPCICGTSDAPGPCATQCAEGFCAAVPPPGAPLPECTDCAGAAVAGMCSAVRAQCFADPDCLAFQACRALCPN